MSSAKRLKHVFLAESNRVALSIRKTMNQYFKSYKHGFLVENITRIVMFLVALTAALSVLSVLVLGLPLIGMAFAIEFVCFTLMRYVKRLVKHVRG